jgi:Na+-transporting NADH:ubiquinone oxidoreductase subunit D
MGRLEAFAMANKPWRSFVDGIGNGLGYAGVLILVAVIRELFGKGSLAGYKILGPTSDFLITIPGYQLNNLMVLPAAAMFVIGVLIWVQRSYNPKLVDVS